LQRRLAAILHADIAGYSRRMVEDELGTLNALKARLDLLVGAITQNGGRICNTAGDAVLAEFASVSAAVRCAIDTQRRIAALNDTVPDKSALMLLRIGINLGEVMADDDGQVYGTGVNVAARIEALAEPGGIAVSGRAREQVASDVDVGFAPLGQHRVKNIPTPINVFRVVDTALSATTPPRSRRSRLMSGGAAAGTLVGVLVLAIAGFGFWRHENRTPAPSNAERGATAIEAPAAVDNRLAVLPFRNASGDPQQDYFADAITEDLTGALGRFAEIGVIASEAIAPLSAAQAAPQELRRELGAAYLLTGSVRRDGKKVRLNARLVDTESGLQLWSDHYDRPMGELFDVQDEIVRSVAGEAMTTLGRIESDRVFGKAMPDLEAYDLFIRGRAHLARETRDDNIEARSLFRQAIDRDPRYALAYVGLGWTHYREATRGWSQFMSLNVSEAEKLAQEARRLDTDLSEAYELLGMVLLLTGKYEKSEQALRRAVDINPNSVQALQELGIALAFLGDSADAVQALERAVSLGATPNSRAVASLGMAYILDGHAREAVRFLETHIGGRRDHFYYATLAVAYVERGDVARGEVAARETKRAWPFFDPEAFARQFRNPEDQQRIIANLRTAGLT
jgi:adenylate cyclase